MKTKANPQSEQEVSKHAKPLTRGGKVSKQTTGSKFAPAYWQEKVFRPSYTRDGERHEVAAWYCQLQHGGRRERVKLGTNNREEAARIAARLYKAVATHGWQAGLAEVLPGVAERREHTDSPTIGEFLEAVKNTGLLKTPTLNTYAVCLRWIAARVLGVKGDRSRFDYRGGLKAWRAKIEGAQLETLTAEGIKAALRQHVAQFAKIPAKRESAERSAASFARNARSLFAPDVLKELPFTVSSPFSGVKIEASRVRRYVSTIDAGSLLRDAQTELAVTDPEAFKAVLLALGAGLRRSEIDGLQWQHVDVKKKCVRVMTTETFETKTDDSEAEVFVDAGLIAALEKYRAAATGLFVLESEREAKPNAKRKEYRAAATFARVTAWLRSQGVMARKPIHTLRKEFGSIVAAAADIHVAASQLRHSNIATTAAYYADRRKHVAPEIGAMLKGKAA